MPRSDPSFHEDVTRLVDAVIERVGKRIVLGLPLGLGKASHVANELVGRAAADPGISLTIVTALTLETPRGASELERRFMEPLADRLFAGWPGLSYAAMLRAGTLPANVEVREFFLQAGQWLGVPRAQQNYISGNYTHVWRYLLDAGVNVVAQLVASDGQDCSLSCNPDLTLDLLRARREGRADFVMIGQVNAELPFMGGSARVERAEFDYLLDDPACAFPLFGPPNQPVSLSHYAIGFRVAALIPDGGTLQIGIGTMGDAVCHALSLRHQNNAAFRAVLDALGETPLHAAPFEQGLYGCSEMIADGFLALLENGVISRRVGGKAIHAAFFLGSREFYRRLREMPAARRDLIDMTSVTFVNELYGGEDEKCRARVGGLFFNSAMMATLMGAAVSDGLEDGRVVSGIGGQYNFVAQAFALQGARSIIAVDAVRTRAGETSSNVVWSYGHVSIPRHLRDMVVTEYGIADLRGKTDAAVIAAMLSVTDSAFQLPLVKRAKAAGKLPKSFRLGSSLELNNAAHVTGVLEPLRRQGLLPEYPFGTDFTPEEQRLLPALDRLRRAGRRELASHAIRGFLAGDGEDLRPLLDRMGLGRRSGMRERVYAALLGGALASGT
ncbi:acetyl-CoA hydrolase/transferase C-terminal domain-containing protein [Emcibacter sp. SYSU 3D8]|uniref:acetyl-CoA hydrolase/transferase C-terminal domain-containing protein n=1 Tax=Emcibacter sp. SYSU 3D8 TaxID=3133969 RepID=UPI0031FEBEAA